VNPKGPVTKFSKNIQIVLLSSRLKEASMPKLEAGENSIVYIIVSNFEEIFIIIKVSASTTFFETAFLLLFFVFEKDRIP
jgi:hypothetical protein